MTKPSSSSDAEIIAAIRGHQIVTGALDEKSKRILASRREAVAALKKLQGDSEKAFPALVRATEEAVAELRDAEAKLLEARQAVARIMAERSNRSVAFTRENDRLEAELRETAHPAIDPFISAMWELWHAAAKLVSAGPAQVVTNQVTRRRVVVSNSNVNAVNARRQAIRDAIAIAEDLKLEADQANIPARLEELRRGLPSA